MGTTYAFSDDDKQTEQSQAQGEFHKFAWLQWDANGNKSDTGGSRKEITIPFGEYIYGLTHKALYLTTASKVHGLVNASFFYVKRRPNGPRQK